MSKWQSTTGTSALASSPINTGNQLSLQQSIEDRENAIAQLETKIADLRRYAAIGEAKLSKWRSQVF